MDNAIQINYDNKLKLYNAWADHLEGKDDQTTYKRRKGGCPKDLINGSSPESKKITNR